MAEKDPKKGAGETEKDSAAKSAEPSNWKGTLADARGASQALFGVSEHIVVGAAMDAGFTEDDEVSQKEMQKAIDAWLKKEVRNA